VDSASGSGGGWPAGSASTWASMERRAVGPLRQLGRFTGYHGVGHDAEGNFIRGAAVGQFALLPHPGVPTWIREGGHQ
jgi:hypothetical protein